MPGKIATLFAALFVFLHVNAFAEDKADPLCAAEIHVAVDGNDANPGTREKPLATVQKAKELMRQLYGDRVKTFRDEQAATWEAMSEEQRQKQFGKVLPQFYAVVHIGPGIYELTEPLRFGPEDSGLNNHIIYRGVPGKTVFSGGKTITAWKTVEDGDWKGVWVADIPRTDGRIDHFEQLFVNDRRAVRARYPNEGFLNPAEVRQDVPLTPEGSKEQRTGQYLTAKPGELASAFKDVPADELKYAHLVVHHHWDTTRRIPLGFDSESETIRCQGAPMKHWNPWRTTSQYYVENLRAAFDQPGEWFYDGNAGKVYYRPLPEENTETATAVYPRPGLNRLLEIRAAEGNWSEFLRFEGLTFAYADTPRDAQVMRRTGLPEEITGPLDQPGPSQFEPAQAAFYTGAAVEMDRVMWIEFVDCEVTHVGEYGLRLQNGQECKIERCAFVDLGAGGIRLGHNSSTCVVDNCLIRRAGRFHASAVGLWVGENCCHNQITHNDIGDLYYTGISVGWTWGYKGNTKNNLIAHNRVHKLGQYAMADMGGIYTLGSLHGTVVRDNVFFDIKSYAYGGWGLYPDEGSEGLLLENNLVYDTTDGSFHQHYGKENVVRNNILCFSTPHQVAVTRVEDHLSLTFERNIVYYDIGKCLGYRSDQAKVVWKSNLWWNAAGDVDFNGKTHEQWVAEGKDVGGLVADPLFVDPAKRDFRLKEGSPASKTGFVPFDFTKAGLYGDNIWTDRAAAF